MAWPVRRRLQNEPVRAALAQNKPNQTHSNPFKNPAGASETRKYGVASLAPVTKQTPQRDARGSTAP